MVDLNQEKLKKRLTSEEYHITQEGGTEPAFSGKYYNLDKEGIYCCKVCNAALFSSESKFHSGTGWPSFDKAIHENTILRREDKSHDMIREEIVCAACGAHLGHAFQDGPRNVEDNNNATGERLCINSASLDFVEK